jgi:hypothetical protein
VAFVVTEIGWEYNDEVYYRGEAGGGKAVTIYRDRAKAQAEADRLNFAEILKQEENLMCFGYSVDEIFANTDTAQVILERNGYEGPNVTELEYGRDWSEFNKALKKMNEADQRAFANTLNVRFFEVQKAELAD